MGAEKAGNADGTIPAWDGGITRPAGYKPGKHYVDPFAADKPLFTITAPTSTVRRQAHAGPGRAAQDLPRPTR
jgi:hypothetical protein